MRALARLARESYAGIFVDGEHLNEAFRIGKLLQNERILQGMPDGIVLSTPTTRSFGATAALRSGAAAIRWSA